MSGKKFRFSLHDVLELRRHQAERAEQDLARAYRDRQAQESALEAAERRLHELAHRTPTSGVADLVSLRQLAAYRLDAQRAAQAEAQTLERLRREEAQAKRTLVLKRRPEEALAILRDDEHSAHRKAADDAESAFLDEQAVVAHCRKQREAA
jgi:flagellar export protein FliJ